MEELEEEVERSQEEAARWKERNNEVRGGPYHRAVLFTFSALQ